jgi:Phosphotransferase enzyme family
MNQFPIRSDELTAEWLAEALGAPGQLRGFDANPMGTGVGLVGNLSKVALDWDGHNGPEAVVAKFPAAGEESRFVATVLRMYEREVRAYEQLTPRSPLGSPARYYSAFDPDTHDFTLVLGELSGRNPDQLQGCTEKEAMLAVDRLAAHHAAFWVDGDLAGLGWLPTLDDPQIVGAVQVAFASAWPTLAASVLDLRTPELDALCARFPELIPGLMSALSEPPFTLAHGDYRVDNMFFDGPDLALCDWQLVCRARGPYDLGYFTTQSLTVESRREWEPDLLARYVDGLAANGVTGYAADDVQHDYRVAALFCLVYPVIAGGSLTVEDERHTVLCRTMFGRCVAAIADLDCLELV